MAKFAMLTRVDSDAVQSPDSLKSLESEVVERIRSDCPDVRWIQNLAVLGPCDHLDIFEAPDIDEALKVAAIIRSVGHARTEIWAAKDWAGYKELLAETT